MKKFCDRRLSALVASAMLVSFAGCAVDSHRNSATTGLIGLWKSENPTVHAVTLRNQDGTYRRKVVQNYDFKRPPVSYEERGRWSVRRDQYVWAMEQVSTPLWKDEVGKQRQVKILSIDESKLRRLSTDEAVIEERRIGAASDAAFEAAQLDVSVVSSRN